MVDAVNAALHFSSRPKNKFVFTENFKSWFKELFLFWKYLNLSLKQATLYLDPIELPCKICLSLGPILKKLYDPKMSKNLTFWKICFISVKDGTCTCYIKIHNQSVSCYRFYSKSNLTSMMYFLFKNVAFWETFHHRFSGYFLHAN